MTHTPFKLLSLALMAATLLLAGCSQQTGDTPPPAPNPGFALEPAFTTLELPPGGEVSSFVALKRDAGFTETVEMTFEGLPDGFSQEWTRDSTNGDCSVRLAVAGGTAPGSYTLTLVGKPASEVAATRVGIAPVSQQVNVIVAGPSAGSNPFTVSANPNLVEVAQGQLATFRVNTRKGHADSGSVTLSLEGAPSGIGVHFAQNPVAIGQGTDAQLIVAATLAPGEYAFKVKGEGLGAAMRTDLRVTVRPAADFTFNVRLTRPSLEMPRGLSASSATLIVIERIASFAAAVELSVQNLPDGVTAVVVGSGDTRRLELTVADTVAFGTYSLTVKGEGGGQVKTVPFELTVVDSADRPEAGVIGAGALDTSFGEDGTGFLFLPGFSVVSSLTPLNNGKLLVAGHGSLLNSGTLLLLNADGTPDSSFGIGGVAQNPGFQVKAATALPGGKFAVVGPDASGNPGGVARVARYNANGTLDISFGQNGVSQVDLGGPEAAFAIFPAPDNKLVLVTATALLRLTPGGNLDPDFNSGSGRKPVALSLRDNDHTALLDAQGRIVVAGVAEGLNAGYAAARLSLDGVLDTSFTRTGRVSLASLGANTSHGRLGLSLDGQGRILLAGGAPGGGGSGGFIIARLTDRGVFDTSFGENGKVTVAVSGSDIARAVVVPSRGRMFVAGMSTSSVNGRDFVAVALDNSGALDGSFGEGGRFRFGFERPTVGLASPLIESFEAAIVLESGNVLAAGTSQPAGSSPRLALARFEP